MALDITENDFESVVLEGSKQRPVVVDFWAAWCGPCRTLGPMIERLADEYDLTLAKVDVDANQALAGAFGIQSIPTVMAFKDGALVDRFVGALPEQQVRVFMESLQPSEADRLVAQAAALDDDGEREGLYRSALAIDRGHGAAVLGLARVLGERGDVTEAKDLLSRIPANAEVDRLRAELDLGASVLDDEELEALRRTVATDPFDEGAVLRLGRAEAATGRYREALVALLAGVERGVEGAREAMVEIFTLLGDVDPLTVEFRKRLSAALF